MINNLSIKLLKNRPDNISEEVHMVKGIDAELFLLSITNYVA